MERLHQLNKSSERRLGRIRVRVSVSAIMILLTSKVDNKIVGIDDFETTTKDLVEPGGKNNPNPTCHTF